MNTVKPPHPAFGHLLPRSHGKRHGTDETHGAVIARQLLLQGRVQGLGVRPAIAKLALRLKLNGSVANTSDGVLIHLEGIISAIDEFQFLLAGTLPVSAVYRTSRVIDVALAEHQDFRIDQGSPSSITAVDVPVDLAMCPECARELPSPVVLPADRATASFDQCHTNDATHLWSCSNCAPVATRSITTARIADSMHRQSPVRSADRNWCLNLKQRPMTAPERTPLLQQLRYCEPAEFWPSRDLVDTSCSATPRTQPRFKDCDIESIGPPNHWPSWCRIQPVSSPQRRE